MVRADVFLRVLWRQFNYETNLFKNQEKRKGLQISPATPVETSRLVVVARAVVEVVAAAEAECETVVLDVVFRSPALLASLRLHHFVPRHRLSATTTLPVGLLAEDSWVGLRLLLTDVFPLWSVAKTHAVNARTVGILLTCKITMVHSNPPFWPPVFLGAAYVTRKIK